MKIKIIILVMLLETTSISNSMAVNAKTIKNIAEFAKVWGFLKYYYPQVAKGNPDWDKELFKMIPLIKQAGGQDGYNRLLGKWYASLPEGFVSDQITRPNGDSILRIFNFKDIKALDLPISLREKFIKLYLYHLPDSNKYITNRYNGYLYDHIIHRENPFDKPTFPDEEHRLLALIRYWNIINIFYPYKTINVPQWNNILVRYIPLFIANKNVNDYRRTFLLLTAELHDGHSLFIQHEWDLEHNAMNPPFRPFYVKGHYYIGYSRNDSLMNRAGLKAGDEIIRVNQIPVKELEKALKPFSTGANRVCLYRNIAISLCKPDSSRVMELIIKRHGNLLKKEVPMSTYDELNLYRQTHPLPMWEDLGKGRYYVRICQIFNLTDLKKMFITIHRAKVVIMEMRDYPDFNTVRYMNTGFYAVPVKTEINYTGITEFPGTFVARKTDAFSAIDTLKLPLYSGKLIVLVNEYTQSLSESISAALRLRPNTLIMGRQTAGTTGNIVYVDYPGEIEASFTATGVKGLDQSFTEGKGVKIDKVISLSKKKMTSSRDYLLQQAIKEALKVDE